jgi:hypothetical protein
MTIFLQAPAAALMLLPIMMMVIFAVALVPAIFFLLTLQNTLKAIAPQNRSMPPGQVWLSLIPIFNIFWNFFVVGHMANSIQAELTQKGAAPTERPAHSIGLAMCILPLCGWVPLLGGLAGLAAMVCWIIYWIKIAEFKRQIETLEYVKQDDEPDSLIFGNDPI